MATDKELAEVLGDFARTMLTDFPIQGILDRLVQKIVEIMPVSGAGVTLISDGVGPQYVSASDPVALRYEELQTQLGEGPCVLTYQTGEAVAVPDLRREARFGTFRDSARAEGLAAVWTFPLRQRDKRLGALDLYRSTPGRLDAATMSAAQTLADVTAAYLVNAQARSDLERSSAEALSQALHDPLTGLPNRTLLLERLDHVLLSGDRTDAMVAVLYVDLDHFKAVNDDHGHGVGDELLVGVARRLTSLLRTGDTLARMSGDEFVVVCESLVSARQADMIAARIVQALTMPFSFHGFEVSISASVGIAFAGPGALLPEHLLHEADIAMYQAKRKGGRSHHVIDLRARDLDDERRHLEEDLRGAARRGELRNDYQPLVTSGDGCMVGVEALLRWDHRRLGLVSPAVLIPLAERSGTMSEIGGWVLERACADRRRWCAGPAGPDLEIAVNVSARQLEEPTFAPMVASVLERTGTSPSVLTLEITEGVLLGDADHAAGVLGDLRATGVKIALDDFGTGYSSLTYLRRLPIDIVKIDRGFVANILLDHPSRSIITKVIELSHLLGMVVVAEGVETPQQRDELLALGSESCQGFYFARPMSADDLETLMSSAPAPGRPVHLPMAAV